MDFIRVGFKENKDGTREFHPSLQALESEDLVIRGGQFMGVWDEAAGLYSRRISHLPAIVDRAFYEMVQPELREGDVVKKVRNFDNQLYNRIISLIRNIGDMGPDLDRRLVFADQTPTKADAATFKLPYSLTDAPCPSWEEIVSTLYAPEERLKFEWAIGSILTGQAKDIQKFYVFFGPPGSGKSTIMNIIEMLFEGHTAAFSAFNLGKADAQFSLEPFKNNPLVAVDQDGDLAKIEINTLLNQIVAHDKININAKGKSLYEIIPRTTLFVGTNEPIKISNRKSGLFRRVVDIQPTGNLFDETRYHALMKQVEFELGAIANHCMNIFNSLGPTYLSSYRSMDMMYRTNDIFNFVEDNRLILAQGISLKQAHKLYVDWCDETDTRNHYKQFQFRDLLRDYFKEFHAEIMLDGTRHRSWFMDLRELEKFSWKGLAPEPPKSWLELDTKLSIFDGLMADMPAQEASQSGVPKKAWDKVTTTLSEMDTSVEHYVKVPEAHIVIDFDLKDDNGTKSLERNLAAASKWPPTYAEVSRGGGGLHLHYDYSGNVADLASGPPDGSYEIKSLLGGSALRRRLSLCNDIPVATMSSGLPTKEVSVLPAKYAFNERRLREQILKGLRKGVHVGTKSNMDYLEMILKEAYESGEQYDVSDMWDDIFGFAMASSNQQNKCIEIAMRLKLKSEDDVAAAPDGDAPIAYFDCEIFPNLFLIGYMLDRDDAEVVVMVNPSPQEVEELFTRFRLLGWNNRGYDNHICWARTLGYENAELYKLSQRIIVDNDRRAGFGPAYNAAYGDLYDMASNDNMKSLKKWEIDLDLPHMENDHPWDQPVPDEKVLEIVEYLKNDVRSTRAVAKAIDADVRARQILAELSGLAVCNTNRQHTEKLIFGGATKEGHADLVYTDLREDFPGYVFDQFASGKEKSTYRGEKVGEGGWVKAKPGMYENVLLLDVASMHPASIIAMNVFGKYTPKFKELLDLRLTVKALAKPGAVIDESLLPANLTGLVKDNQDAKALSDALKIVINSVYGLTAASFPNTFKDPRNIDNIVAKRGALFMVDLVNYLDELKIEWIHVKTDSVKVVLPSPEARKGVYEAVAAFGSRYGYEFEDEALYERFCLVNDAVYVCREDGKWKATGKQFQHPVVFKTLFTDEELRPRDYVEVKQVNKGAMYLVSQDTNHPQFVGRFGAFVPVMGGRELIRIIDDVPSGAVNGAKGHLWEIDELAFNELMDVDFTYFQNLIDEGRKTIEKYGSFADFTRP